MKENNLKHIFIYIAIAILVICSTFAASYAIFVAVVRGNENAKRNEIISGNLEIDFETSEYITNGMLDLIDLANVNTQAPKTIFTITNKNSSTIDADYKLYITDLTISDNLKSADFKWKLSLVDQSTSVETDLSTGNFATATTGTDIELLSTAKNIPVSTSHKYKLRVWLQNDPSKSQNSLSSGTFKAKVRLESSKIGK